MDSVFSFIELENNRQTIKNLWIYPNKFSKALSEIDKILLDKERLDYFKIVLEQPFSVGTAEHGYLYQGSVLLNVEYINESKKLIEENLYFEFNNYILEFRLPPSRNTRQTQYCLKHIHKIDSNVMEKRKLLGTDKVVLTAEQIDELLKQGKIHQII